MIVSFGSKDTEKISNGIRVAKLPIEIQTIGRGKLRMINNSQNIQDLAIPPSNKFEKKKGDLKDFTVYKSMTSGGLFLNGITASQRS